MYRLWLRSESEHSIKSTKNRRRKLSFGRNELIAEPVSTAMEMECSSSRSYKVQSGSHTAGGGRGRIWLKTQAYDKPASKFTVRWWQPKQQKKHASSWCFTHLSPTCQFVCDPYVGLWRLFFFCVARFSREMEVACAAQCFTTGRCRPKNSITPFRA